MLISKIQQFMRENGRKGGHAGTPLQLAARKRNIAVACAKRLAKKKKKTQ